MPATDRTVRVNDRARWALLDIARMYDDDVHARLTDATADTIDETLGLVEHVAALLRAARDGLAPVDTLLAVRDRALGYLDEIALDVGNRRADGQNYDTPLDEAAAYDALLAAIDEARTA